MLRRILLKLYHIEQELQQHAQAIRNQNRTLAGLREEQRKHEQELEAARAEQARARSSVMQKEKRIKKAEKALEGKVCAACCQQRVRYTLTTTARDPILYRSKRKSSTLSEGATTR